MCGVEVIVLVVCFQAVPPCDHLSFELMSAHSYISISVQRLYVKLSRAMSKERLGTMLVCVTFIVANRPGTAETVPDVLALSRCCPGRGKIVIMSLNL